MLEEIIKRVIAHQQKHLSAINSVYLPTHVATSWNDASPVELINDVKTHFLTSSQKVLLLLGEPALGKTRSCQQLALELLHHWQPGLPIPLYISLAGLQNPAKRLIDETLESFAIELKWLPELKRTQRFVFILDGYDELTFAHNLYVSNELDAWQAQVIISCRWQFLKEQGYRRCFAPQEKDTKKYQEALVMERILVPLPLETIDNHLQTYVEKHPELIVKNVDSYQAYLHSHPSLKSCMMYPFLWQPVLNALAEVIKNSSSAVDSTGTMLLPQETEEAIYKRVLEAWFKRQAEKTKKLAVDDCWSYAIVLATRWQHAEPLSEEEADLLFTPHETKIKLAKLACPLRKQGSTYAFIAPAFGQYLARQPMTEAVKTFIAALDPEQVLQWPHQLPVSEEERYQQWLSQCLQDPRNLNPFDAVAEAGILNQDKDRVHTEEGYKDSLFEIVKFSRQDPPSEVINTAAARAITILNYARVPFSEMDLSRIKIPRADLSRAILHRTIFIDGNLQGVNFTNAYIAEADFSGSHMDSVQFGQLYFKHNYEISSVTLSFNNQWLATGGASNAVQIWRMEDGSSKEILSVQGILSRIDQVAFSLDNEWLAAGSKDGTVILWKLTGDNFSLQPILKEHSAAITCIAFSPNGCWLASGSDDSSIIIWNIKKGIPWRNLKEHSNNIRDIAFSYDSKWLVSGSSDKLIFWKISLDQDHIEVFNQSPNWTNCVAFSWDSQWLATVKEGSNNVVYLWKVNNGLILNKTLKGNQQLIWELAFSFDNQLLASAGEDKTVRIWNVSNGRLLYVLEGYTRRCNSVAFSFDNQWLASGSEDKIVRCWQIKYLHQGYKIQGHNNNVNTVTFSPDGQWLVSGSDDKTAKIWKLPDARLAHTLLHEGMGEWIVSVTFSHNNQWLATKDLMGKVKLWQVGSWNLVHTLWGGGNNYSGLAFSFDDRWLAAGGDKGLQLWQVEEWGKNFMLKLYSELVYRISFTSDNKWLAAGCADGYVRVWDFNNFKLQPILKGHVGEVLNVSFSYDNQWLVSSAEDNTIILWKVPNWNTSYQTVRAHKERITSIAFSFSDNWLAIGSLDKTLQLWRLMNNKLQHHITINHPYWINSVAFSLDTQWLASGGDDKAVRLWRIKKQNNSIYGYLHFATHYFLFASKTNLKGVKGLTVSNEKLLEQHGAINIQQRI